MSVNAREEKYESIELFGKPALFTNSRIDRDTVPEGFHCYDLRGSDNDPGRPVTVEKSVGVNHAGTVLTTTPVKLQKDRDFRRISGKLNFLGEELGLSQFCEEHGLTLHPDNRTFTLRPASPDEVGLFYSQEEKDAELGCVGHLRLDFGHGGQEFHHTWWAHNDNRLNTPAFKAELEVFMDEMRKHGPLQDLREMQSYCYTHGGVVEESRHHGYIAESEQYRYCLRCTPTQGDYNGYLYIYDKRQQELYLSQTEPEQGMTMGGMQHGF